MPTILLQLNVLVIAASSIPVAGAAMLTIVFVSEKKKTVEVFRSWKYLQPSPMLLAAGVFCLV